MKKVSLNSKLSLKKNTVSKFDAKKVKGGHTGCCPTDGPLNSCPPPGQYCY